MSDFDIEAMFPGELGPARGPMQTYQVPGEAGQIEPIGFVAKAQTSNTNASDTGADVLSLFGEASSSSLSAEMEPVPSEYTPTTLVAMYSVAAGAAPDAVHALLAGVSGMKVKDARGTLTALSNALQHLSSGDMLGGLLPLDKVKLGAAKHSPQSFLNAMKFRAAKRCMFIPPSQVVNVFLQQTKSKLARLVPDYSKKTLIAIFGDGRRRTLPPVEQLTDDIVMDLVRDLRELNDAAYETCLLQHEEMVKLAVYLHPMRIAGNRIQEMDAVLHARYLASVDPTWVERVTINGRIIDRLRAVPAALVRLVIARSRKYDVPTGSDTKTPFTALLHSFVNGGVAQLDRVYNAVQACLAGSKIAYTPDAYLSRELWDKADRAVQFEILKKGNTPLLALHELESARKSRDHIVLRKLAGHVDQNGFMGESSVSQMDKIARVLEKLDLPLAGLGEPQNVAVGIDKGFTAPLLSERGFRLYDLDPKQVGGVFVQKWDVLNTMQGAKIMEGAKVFLSDVAVAGTGESSAGEKLERCSYAMNENTFQHLVLACCESKVEKIAIKSFLPNSDVAHGVFPPTVSKLLSHFVLRAYKCGKIHGDELFYIGTRRPQPVEVVGPLALPHYKDLLMDWVQISLMCREGNKMIRATLASGTCGPRFRVVERRLEISWAGRGWSRVSLGEYAWFMYTHEMSQLLLSGRESLPLFGVNAGVHVSNDEVTSVLLHEMYVAHNVSLKEEGESSPPGSLLSPSDEAPLVDM